MYLNNLLLQYSAWYSSTAYYDYQPLRAVEVYLHNAMQSAAEWAMTDNCLDEVFHYYLNGDIDQTIFKGVLHRKGSGIEYLSDTLN
jgi:hypothetical protein